MNTNTKMLITIYKQQKQTEAEQEHGRKANTVDEKIYSKLG